MRSISLSLIVAALSMSACGNSEAATSSITSEAPRAAAAPEAPAFRMISVQDVAAAVTSHDAQTVVLDANRRETFNEHHVPGATWVGHDVTAENLPADSAKRLVFYCANEECSASHTAARTAMQLGHPNVFVMGAGIQGWVAAGEPVETATPSTGG